ncbi:MAG: VWA domain-containing protein [Burkholderiaceae bacterium]
MKRTALPALVLMLLASACAIDSRDAPVTDTGGDIAHRREAARTAQAFAAPMPGTMPSPVARPFPMPAPPGVDRERYQSFESSPVRRVSEAPVSTFGIDVDTGSYSNVRRMLVAGRLPPKDAVRVEEMINYFPYDYAGPSEDQPFAVHAEMVDSPWREGARLLRIGIKGEDRAREDLPPANLVFLVDVSGSMRSADKLPLLKSSLRLLVQGLRPQDRISIVTYASGTTLVLRATAGDDTLAITNAIETLQAGGGTAGASGIELAYRTAQQAWIDGGINRILLATDGDFNVGVTDFGQLESMVQERRKSGIALSTLGFGSGNYNEHLMERLADAGDGAYSYIDSLMEAHKVLVNEASSTLETIARDVKIQVEFNPARVAEYRLIGYENRMLAREDFNNDRVDAGDIGAGHSVTALYELTLAGAPGYIDPPRYDGNRTRQTGAAGIRANETGQGASRAVGRHGGAAAEATEFAFVKLRYKRPGGNDSILLTRPVTGADVRKLDAADADSRFAIAVAGFGQLLRGGRYTDGWDWRAVRRLAADARGEDRFGYRGEFLRLVDLAATLGTRAPRADSGGG